MRDRVQPGRDGQRRRQRGEQVRRRRRPRRAAPGGRCRSACRPPSVRPQTLVASEPAYVVGHRDDRHRPVSAIALASPVAEPPPTATRMSTPARVGGAGGPPRQLFRDVLGHLGPAQRGPAGQRVHQRRMPLAADHHDRTRLQPVELRADPRDGATPGRVRPLAKGPMREPHLSPPRAGSAARPSTAPPCRRAPPGRCPADGSAPCRPPTRLARLTLNQPSDAPDPTLLVPLRQDPARIVSIAVRTRGDATPRSRRGSTRSCTTPTPTCRSTGCATSAR